MKECMFFEYFFLGAKAGEFSGFTTTIIKFNLRSDQDQPLSSNREPCNPAKTEVKLFQ